MKPILLLLFIIPLILSCKGTNPTNPNKNIIPIDSGLVLLTIIQKDCIPCNILLMHPYYKKYPQHKIIIDIEEKHENKLLAQSLWNVSFPIVYFITSDYNIIGITQGYKEFVQYADSIALYNKRFSRVPIELRGIKKEKTLSTLSYSLKALNSYQSKDWKMAKLYAQQSLAQGSFIFNNYLLYKIYEHENQSDSMRFYKEKAYQLSLHESIYLYYEIIEQLCAE